jgi:DNA-binding XRE family transcriptional regulator
MTKEIQEKRKKGMAHPVDLFVGKGLRVLRQSRSMSQEKMAFRVGLTFQQIQKCEKGLNRISCSKLYEFARLLNVRVQDFFEGFVWHDEGGGDIMADSANETAVYNAGGIEYGLLGCGGNMVGGVSERDLEKIVSAVVSSEEEQIKDKVTKVLRVLGKLGKSSSHVDSSVDNGAVSAEADTESVVDTEE